MAKVKVQWTETREFEAEVEVDGFEGTPDELLYAIDKLTEAQMLDAEIDESLDVEISGHSIVRDGDEPITVAAPRKQYEEMF